MSNQYKTKLAEKKEEIYKSVFRQPESTGIPDRERITVYLLNLIFSDYPGQYIQQIESEIGSYWVNCLHQTSQKYYLYFNVNNGPKDYVKAIDKPEWEKIKKQGF